MNTEQQGKLDTVHQMFPSHELEVLTYYLEENAWNVDKTIDFLLTETSAPPTNAQPAVFANSPNLTTEVSHSINKQHSDSPTEQEKAVELSPEEQLRRDEELAKSLQDSVETGQELSQSGLTKEEQMQIDEALALELQRELSGQEEAARKKAGHHHHHNHNHNHNQDPDFLSEMGDAIEKGWKSFTGLFSSDGVQKHQEMHEEMHNTPVPEDHNHAKKGDEGLLSSFFKPEKHSDGAEKDTLISHKERKQQRSSQSASLNS